MIANGNNLSQCWDFPPGHVYLNHGSFGACPSKIIEIQHEMQRELERQPMEFLVRKLEGLHRKSRERLSRFVGCSAEDLVFVSNATEAVNTVLRSLSFQSDDEILVTNHTYQACRNAVDIVARQAGAKVVVAQIPFPCRSEETVIEAIEDVVSNRTRFALIDHVTSPTALVLPIKHLVSTLEAQGVMTMVDGAHAVGMLPLELDNIGASFYTSNCHKWLCAPKSSAFLYVKPELQSLVRPLSLSHAASLPDNDGSRFQKEFGWPGTHDPTPYLVIPDCIDFISSVDGGNAEAWMTRNRRATLKGREAMLSEFQIGEPCPDSMIGAMAALPLPDGDATELQRTLLVEHHIEVVVSPWPNPQSRLIRFSMQAYNSQNDVDALVTALKAIL